MKSRIPKHLLEGDGALLATAPVTVAPRPDGKKGRKLRARPAGKKPRVIAPSTVEQEIGKACEQVVALRKRPLLVLYYPGQGRMREPDLQYCHNVLRKVGTTPEKPLPKCDVLLHTSGGDPIAAYRLAQCIRDYARHVVFLVPDYAYSAGTLLTFAGNEIRLGHSAGLSPIDISVVETRQTGRHEVELASIDYYLSFAVDCQERIQQVLAKQGIGEVSPVGSQLLCRLVDQVTAFGVGAFYRARTLTGHYAEELLSSYMLAGKANIEGRCRDIIGHFLFGKPVHDFHMDYHLAVRTGLAITEMGTAESDATKNLVNVLRSLVSREKICAQANDERRYPFLTFYV